MKKINLCIAVLLSISFVIACTKKREPSLPHGADRDLQTIATYENQEWDLQTADVLKSASTGSKLKMIDDRKKTKDQIRNFDFVRYTSQDPLKLTDDSLMLGLPNHLYKVKYLFEGHTLKVMKIGQPEELASDEQTVAIDAGDGRFMVPIVSYDVEYYSIDGKRNEHNEETSTLETINQQQRIGSSHFRIIYRSKSRASYLSKPSLLPASFFDGDWYMGATVIGQNHREQTSSLGEIFNYDKYNRRSGKVRARKYEDKIVFFNLAVDEEILKTLNKREENQSPALILPVEFVDFQFKPAGKTQDVEEEINKDKAWDQRKYADLQLKKVELPGQPLNTSEVKDLQVSDGYFSFTLKSETLGALIRFSFYNVDAYKADVQTRHKAREYQPRVYFREDQKLFGFFATSKEQIQTPTTRLKQNFDENVLMNRFNPTRQSIEYRLNAEAPAWAESAAKKAIQGWNATFEAAGSSLRLKFTDESGNILRGQPGDLRYNLINILDGVEHLTQANWGGYGPFLTDPQTGEIIAAMANINARDRIEGFVQLLERYLLSLRGELDERWVLGLPFPSLKVVFDAAAKTLKTSSTALQNRQSATVFDSQSQSFQKNIKVILTEPRKSGLQYIPDQQSRQDVIHGNLVSIAEEICPEIKTYALKSRESQTTDSEKEAQMIQSCAIKLAEINLVELISHEIGHNLGLRHNFYGSADTRNFYQGTQLKIGAKSFPVKWQSSSVMDYQAIDLQMLPQPGPYDIAAIRWGYQNQMESPTKSALVMDPRKPTLSQIKGPVKEYMFCSDEEIDLGLDPLCAKYDSGQDPEAAVAKLIQQYESSLAIWNHRLGREQFPHWGLSMTQLAELRLEKYLIPLLKYYYQWRLIVASQAGPGNEYLDGFNPGNQADYMKFLERITEEKTVGAEKARWYRKYRNAADQIFKFLVRMALTPDRSCLVSQPDLGENHLQLLPLIDIQTQIYNQKKVTVQSCQDPEAAAYLKSRNAIFKSEVGFPFLDRQANLSDLPIQRAHYQFETRPEVIGIVQDRYLALIALSHRGYLGYSGTLPGFAPNFIDEVHYRIDFRNQILSRLTNGVHLKSLPLQDSLRAEIPEAAYSPLFTTEKPLLMEMISSFKQGLLVPMKDHLNNLRVSRYAILPPNIFQNDDSAFVCFSAGGLNYCAKKDQHVESYILAKRLMELQEQQTAPMVSKTAVDQLWQMIEDLIPAAGGSAQLDFTFLPKLFERVSQVQKSNSSLGRELAYLLRIFSIEDDLWGQASMTAKNKMQMEGLSPADRDKRLEELRKTKVQTMAQQMNWDLYKPLDREVQKARLNELFANRTKAQQLSSERNNEINAQIDILTHALTH